MRMSYSFTKLFSSITDSSIWSEDSDTRIVWVTMLAMADRHGQVLASLPGLARRAVVGMDVVQRAIEKFKAPDPYSRTKDFDGRRIEDIEGGWRLLNYEHYRDLRDDEAERERKREWARRNASKRTTNSRDCTQAEAEAEAEAEGTEKSVAPLHSPPRKPAFSVDDLMIPTKLHTDAFMAVWKEWVAYRMGLKKVKDWAKLFRYQLELLSEHPVEDSIRELKRALAGGWQCFHFPDRPQRSAPPSKIADDDGWGDSTAEEIAKCNPSQG